MIVKALRDATNYTIVGAGVGESGEVRHTGDSMKWSLVGDNVTKFKS